MVSLGAKGSISAHYVAAMRWEHRAYASGPGRSLLILHTLHGERIEVEHDPAHVGWGGVDAYAVERAILEAHGASC